MIALRAKELERSSRTDPTVLDRKELLAMFDCEDWSVRMHVCRMLSRVPWPPDEYPEALEFALSQARDDNAFIRAWALDALASFAMRDDSIRPTVFEMLDAAMSTGPASVRVRAREGLKRLGND